MEDKVLIGFMLLFGYNLGVFGSHLPSITDFHLLEYRNAEHFDMGKRATSVFYSHS